MIYEGHDAPRSHDLPDPKTIDQPERTPSGMVTENGKFYRSALQCKSEGAAPRSVRVYEKIRQGIWSYNGVFHLVDAWRERDGQRNAERGVRIGSSPRRTDGRRYLISAPGFRLW